MTWNNSKYSVLGDAQEHETANTFAVSLTMSQVVVESDQFFQDLMDAMKKQTMPSWTFQGSLLGIGGQESEGGDSGHEERVIYRGCVPSGQVDIQNVAVGDVIKRNWNFFVNKPLTGAGRHDPRRRKKAGIRKAGRPCPAEGRGAQGPRKGKETA